MAKGTKQVDKVGYGDYHVGIGDTLNKARKEKEAMAEERAEVRDDFLDFAEASADANGYTKEFIELLKGLTEEEKRKSRAS